jgi:predicted N-acyltransferase
MANLRIKTAASVHEIDPEGWERLSAGRAFQSQRWYAYGEKVMADCRPLYLLAYEEDELIGRAALWLVRNEPLPKMVGIFQRPAVMLLRRWPLLICRSPLANTSGIIVQDGKGRAEILAALAKAGLEAARKLRASFLIFDYLSRAAANPTSWPDAFVQMSTFDPGMSMENRWSNLDEYLASGGKKDRQHYKRVLREAGELGMRVERHHQAERIEEALHLMRGVESSHGALPNPWARGMLEHMEMVDATWLTATIEERLVGCGLLVEDNGSQMTSVLGLEEGVPYVYFMLVYESLKMALENRVRLLRWGSGAREVKERLGFSAEDNGALVFTAVSPIIRRLIR